MVKRPKHVYDREYYLEHREQIREYQNRYYSTRKWKEWKKKWGRNYYQKHKSGSGIKTEG